MLGASDQSRDDLRDTTLLALMGVSHQALHVCPQKRKEVVTKIAEQSLKKKKKKQEKGTD